MTEQPPQDTGTSSFWKGVRNLVAAAAVLSAVATAIWYFAIRDDFHAAQTGDCLNVPASIGLTKEIDIVGCDSLLARSTVLGAVRGKAWSEISQGKWTNLCRPWPEAKAAVLHAKNGADTGDVLCIKPVDR